VTTTHIQTLLTMLGGVIVTLTGLVSATGVLWRELRRNTVISKNTNKLVNGRYSAQHAYIQILIAAMQQAGITVPVDPSAGLEETE
jgi:hypothetical protein